MKKSGALWLIGGGVAVGAAAWFASRKSVATTTAVERALADEPDPDTGERGLINVKLTGYWPFTARPDEVQMEGGTKDRKGNPLHTVEDFLAGKSDHVSLSGDDALFPYGQKIIIPWGDREITGRVTDTGSHFRGVHKVYRVAGYEPIDVCVQSSATKIPKTAVQARIVAGDNFEKGKAVATGGFQGQNVIVGTLAPTEFDHEALARAIESELGGRSAREQHAAAWALRNRAEVLGLTLGHMLAPRGEWGSPQRSGGFASTRREATVHARQLASDVLGSDNSQDPTEGAIDYWVPSQQARMCQLGDIHRAALRSGDATKAKAYERYAGYGTEGDVRSKHAREGLRPTKVIGAVELLGRG